MNKYNSESYGKQAHTPAIHMFRPDIPPLVLSDKLMTREAAIMLIDIQPTDAICESERVQMTIDEIDTGRFGDRFEQLFKKK